VKRYIFILLLITFLMVRAEWTVQGGLLTDLGTSVVVGIERNFFIAKAISINASVSYAYGSESDRWLWFETNASHHLIMPGVDFSAYLIKGRVKNFEPYLDFGGGYVFAVGRKKGTKGETDTGINNGGFVKITFGSDFPVKAPVMPFVEMGAWVIVGVGGGTHTNFALLSGLRF